MGLIKKHLSELSYGEIQNYKNMSLVPLFSADAPGLDYLMLPEALEAGLLEVAEVSKGGSVGQLKVVNSGKKAVLILDGEELSGAKQNRVLNTTMLIAAGASEIIPVSCTEAGRWSYNSAVFSDSGNVMSPNLRAAQNQAVTDSLKHAAGGEGKRERFRGNQSETWERIRTMHDQAGTDSATGAMSDAYAKRSRALSNYLNAFKVEERQIGLAVIISAKVIGLDTLSKPRAYKLMHKKLVKSYAMEALISREKKTDTKLGPSMVELFIDAAAKGAESRYDSVSLGRSIRLKGDKVVGSALEYQGNIIHCACFGFNKDEDPGPISSAGRRSAFRY